MISRSNSRALRREYAGILLAGLAMSDGWGFRGDYGHEAGAMVPQDERPSLWLQNGAVMFLLILMFWANFHKTVRNWRLAEAIPETTVWSRWCSCWS